MRWGYAPIHTVKRQPCVLCGAILLRVLVVVLGVVLVVVLVVV